MLSGTEFKAICSGILELSLEREAITGTLFTLGIDEEEVRFGFVLLFDRLFVVIDELATGWGG